MQLDIAAICSKNPNYRADLDKHLFDTEAAYCNIDIEKTEEEDRAEKEYLRRLRYGKHAHTLEEAAKS